MLVLEHLSVIISIHAPVKGATRTSEVLLQRGVHFNPRTREGCDTTFRKFYDFQKDFNPRTREGCDIVLSDISESLKKISIHAPVKGATGLAKYGDAECWHFNPRTREGCD